LIKSFVKFVFFIKKFKKFIFEEKSMTTRIVYAGLYDSSLVNLPGPKLEEGKSYDGKIGSIYPFGVFVRFGDDNIGYREGLLHITEIQGEDVEKFQKISSMLLRVLKIDSSRNQIFLSEKNVDQKNI
jgi:polyribonucleotide nucleotidyltransferase